MKKVTEKSGSRHGDASRDPLDTSYLSLCADSSLDLSHVLSLAGSVSSPDMGNGLRSSFRTSLHALSRTPHTPTRLLGVHNPTGTPVEFTVASCFPDVGAGKAHLVFLGGSVETSGRSRTDLRFLLQPGEHVWLAQTDAPFPSPEGSVREGAADR